FVFQNPQRSFTLNPKSQTNISAFGTAKIQNLFIINMEKIKKRLKEEKQLEAGSWKLEGRKTARSWKAEARRKKNSSKLEGGSSKEEREVEGRRTIVYLLNRLIVESIPKTIISSLMYFYPVLNH
ncbi:MAG: hypothetical protein RG741_07875, partial [Bacteroidales bacterium]|nr:hypothetical protein [Bacteroidales bacterium]